MGDTAGAPPKARGRGVRTLGADAAGPVGRAAALGLALLLVAAPLAVGGARWGVQLVLAGAALVLLAVSAWSRLADGGLRVPWPLWGPIALVALGLLQLVPLPPAVVEFLSPRAHEVLTYGLGDLGLYGPEAWRPLSLDPPSTWVATFHQAAFAAVALLAANLARRDGRLVERALAYGAGLVALIGFVHWAFGFDRIFGAYEARDIARLTGWFSTFVNANAGAGYLALGALVALGLFTGSSDDRTRRIAAGALTLSAAGCFLTGSRGGHVALVIGLVAFAALAHAPGDEDHGDTVRARARLASRVALVVGGVGLALALLLLPDWQRTHWEDPGQEQKVVAWYATRDYLRDFWAVGSGRGTFGVVYPQYQEIQVQGTVSHAENIVLQLFTEWGVAGGLLALIAGVVGWVTCVSAVGRTTHPAHWGIVAGLGAVGLQQLVDFGFETAGLSLPIAAGFGLCLGRAAQRDPKRRPRRASLAWGAAGGAIALAGLLAWRGPTAMDRHPDDAVRAVRDAGDPLAAAPALVAEHPADHLLPLTVAARLAATRSADVPTVMRWVNRSLFLFPRGGDAHLLAARVLAAAGHGAQAATEYRLALAAQPWRLGRLVHEVARRFPTPALLLGAVPETNRARGALGEALLRGPGPERARATMALALEADPSDVEARAVLARACERLGDMPCVEESARLLIAGGQAGLGQVMLATVAARAGDAATARAALAAAEAAGERDVKVLHRVANVHLLLGDAEGARRLLDKLWPLVALDDLAAANTLTVRAEVEAKLGRPEQALQAWRQAHERDPRPERARRAAEYAKSIGRDDVAARLQGAAEAPRADDEGP